MMKRLLFFLMTMAGILTAQADDYPYLTFETSDGNKQSVSTTSLTLEISGDKLLVNNGEQTFTLTELTKMYFSTDDAAGIQTIDNSRQPTADSPYYTLDGRMLNSKPTQKGIYITGGRKVIVK